VENTQNFNAVQSRSESVGDDIESIGNNRFACAKDTAGVAYSRVNGV